MGKLKKKKKPVKKKIGPPITYTKAVLKNIIKKMEAYIESEDIPVLAEFAYKNDIRRSALYEHKELSYTIKKLIAKKEANLEKMGLVGVINPTMAIFSLKQLGWRDKQEIDMTHSIKKEDLESMFKIWNTGKK